MRLSKVDTPTPPLREALDKYRKALAEINSVKNLIEEVERLGNTAAVTSTMSQLHWALDSVGRGVILESSKKKLEELVRDLADSIEGIRRSGATSYEIARELCREKE